jgi:hypothetical protein
LDVFDQSGQQIHDFNPGIQPDGRFWTTPLSDGNVDVSPGSGRALYQAQQLAVPDFESGFNALTHGPSVPGVVSFRVEWQAAADHQHHRIGNAAHRWTANVLRTSATCVWSGETADASFHTDSSDPFVNMIFAEVGEERSGVFFP